MAIKLSRKGYSRAVTSCQVLRIACPSRKVLTMAWVRTAEDSSSDKMAIFSFIFWYPSSTAILGRTLLLGCSGVSVPTDVASQLLIAIAIAYCLLRIAYCVLLFAYCLLPITYCLLLIAYCLLLIAYYLLLIAYCLLLIAYCLLLIAYCLLPIGNGFASVRGVGACHRFLIHAQ